MLDSVTYRTDGAVMIGENVIGERNIEAMDGDYVSIVIYVGNEENGDGSVYYYVNTEIQPIAIRTIPSLATFSLSLSSQSSIQFISHDIYCPVQFNSDPNEDYYSKYIYYPLLMKKSFNENQTSSFSSSSSYSSLSLPHSQQSQRYNYPSLLHRKDSLNHNNTPSFTIPDSSSVTSYNIPNGLRGVGESILLHIIHECSESKDVIEFLVSSREIARVILNKEFGWGVSHCSSFTIPLRDIPCDKVDIV